MVLHTACLCSSDSNAKQLEIEEMIAWSDNFTSFLFLYIKDNTYTNIVDTKTVTLSLP